MEDGDDATILDFTTLMDDLLYDGFWLETTNDPNFWQPSDLTNPTNPSILTSTFPETPGFSSSQDPSIPSASPAEQTELSRRLWVAPNKNPIPTVSVKKRLVQAINHLKHSMKESDVLVQIWVPVKKRGKQVLTTDNQPFSLNPNYRNLAEYRDVSRNYHFAADEDSKETAGLPGRVFLKKLPEWTPDVRFFKREEYPRVIHAQQYDVRGSLALPVFERGSGKCLGVVEIVTTSLKVNYRPELENICKALEAVDLKSSDVLAQGIQTAEGWNESYQSVLMEIGNVLRCVCDAHKLPLAQTWAPCIEQRKGGCRHSDENFTHCVSTVDSACYVAEQEVTNFHEACSEHHLLKGEGIAGRAFLTNQPCFSEDITQFSKTEYPLAHHARVFHLHAAVAIRLRSIHTGAADFVLEFFLPVNCREADDQRRMLDSLSSVVERTCQSLRVVTDQELAQEMSDREKLKASILSGRSDDGKRPGFGDFRPKEASPSPEASSWITEMMGSQQKGKGVAVELDRIPDFVDDERHDRPDSRHKDGSGSIPAGVKANTEKRRTKAEKSISLQVLRQYFAGSLKDAAKNIGVCPTTLKRICRQHGISRWPSRKIKKVGHSLKKLQLVIDSVQGTEGSLQITSFYNNFPELVSQDAPGKSPLPASITTGQPQLGNTPPEGTLLSPATTTSKSPTSSGSHSSGSGSSFCCSTGVKNSFPVNGALSAEQNEVLLKRARSEAELHLSGHEDSKLLLRSNSQKMMLSKSNHTSNVAQPLPHEGCFRVKAAFGDEKIRLTLQPQWGFRELQQEVWRRFNFDNNNNNNNSSSSRVDMKYLDDDCEWVLLTCEDDLEECKDIHRSLKSRTIRLSLNQAYYNPSLGSSAPF